MFTGLVEEIGCVKDVSPLGNGSKITIGANFILDDAKIGDSVAINGCCLTIIELPEHSFTVEAVEETLKRTNLRDLQTGDSVNLERALKASARLAGHIVQGHIDGTGTVLSREPTGNDSWMVTIETSPQISRYIIEKGSITVDGVSLTIVRSLKSTFSFVMIPHTTHATILGSKKIGSLVNLENDLIAKYIEKFLMEKNET